MAGRRKGSNTLTPLESRIMQVLWSQGPSSVLEVQKILSPSGEFAYNTVQTMLNVLHRKGMVKRSLNRRAYVYRTASSKETVLGQAVRDFVDRMFGGSSEELVMSLIKSNQVNPEQIAKLSKMLAAKKGGKGE